MKLTIFTTTYNRKNLLGRLYNSLNNQTDKRFKWLIVDDGSTDDTESVINGWAKEAEFEIIYIYKANGGMHTGHNYAYQHINTDINMCIDSDDYLPSNSVEIVLKKWTKVEGDPSIAGLVGLNYDNSAKIIGSCFPASIRESTLGELYEVHGVKGDKKLVFRTEVIKKYPPYPTYRGEKLVPLGSLYRIIDQDYKLALLNEPLCTVDYQDTGSSKTIINQYFQSPKGFKYARVIGMKYSFTYKEKLKNLVQYVVACLILRDKDIIKGSPMPFLTMLAIPVGALLFLYYSFKRS